MKVHHFCSLGPSVHTYLNDFIIAIILDFRF
jgi:hypothetical protein